MAPPSTAVSAAATTTTTFYPYLPSRPRFQSRPTLPSPLLLSPALPASPYLRILRANGRPPVSRNPTASELFDSSEQEKLSDADEDEDEDEDGEAAEEYGGEFVSVESDGDGGEVSDGAGVDVASPASSREEVRARVERLKSHVGEFGEGIIDIDELADLYDFPIDRFQRDAIKAFLSGASVVVSAPTSSGKTLIAEAAAAATLAKGRRLLYTTPLKALSNQKYRDFCTTFGENNVGLLTGDATVNKDAQLLIMTTEILRNMLYQSVGMIASGSRLLHVDAIVLDEVHYLSDISRGTVWEEIVIYCPKEVQLICLSATVANPDELAGWIGQIHGETDLVTSTKRPVPLTWHFSIKNGLLPLFDEKGKAMNRKLSLNYLQLSASESKTQFYEDGPRRRNSRRVEMQRNRSDFSSIQSLLTKSDTNSIRRAQVPQIKDTLRHLQKRDMLPTIWFIFSRKGCDAAVDYLDDCKLLNDVEMAEVELSLRKFKTQYPDAVRKTAVKGLLQGIAAHHAGCLPLWKYFIESLFQQGLLKVIFATETLAAGINMPARTAVISSLSKRTETGRTLLSSNELLQMAGRAGRRGIDERGHAVLIQTPYEGAEECCKLLFAGLEPLVSQFTASYGMVLNLLAGAKVINRSTGKGGGKSFQGGKTLEEARKLVERSFGNYVGSNVMVAAKEELDRIQQEIEILSADISEEAIDKKCRERLSEVAYQEISELQEQLRAEKRVRTEIRKKMEMLRMIGMKSLLNELKSDHLPFISLQYKDREAVQQIVPAVYLGKLDYLSTLIKDMIDIDDHLKTINFSDQTCSERTDKQDAKPCFYVGLGSDNSWYLFTEKWIKSVYRSGLPNAPLAQGDALPRDLMRKFLEKVDLQWEKLSDSDYGSIWRMEGSLETWSWSLNVPVLSSLSDDDKVVQISEAYNEAGESYRDQKHKVSRLKKKITSTDGFKEFKKIIDMANFTREKINRLQSRSDRLTKRIEQIEPSGWKNFLQISNVIHEARALDLNTHLIFPLGETAAAIRGENELWLAMVLRNRILLELKPPQLAAVCGSLVSEGIRIRPSKSNNYIYEPSTTVVDIIMLLDEQRSTLLQLQQKHGIEIPCGLDSQFCGMVEAWASGLTWQEMMMDCAMDDGDLARLLRRTIDLLAQIPKLPDIDRLLQNNALTAANIMDRTPISELVG